MQRPRAPFSLSFQLPSATASPPLMLDASPSSGEPYMNLRIYNEIARSQQGAETVGPRIRLRGYRSASETSWTQRTMLCKQVKAVMNGRRVCTFSFVIPFSSTQNIVFLIVVPRCRSFSPRWRLLHHRKNSMNRSCHCSHSGNHHNPT